MNHFWDAEREIAFHEVPMEMFHYRRGSAYQEWSSQVIFGGAEIEHGISVATDRHSFTKQFARIVVASQFSLCSSIFQNRVDLLFIFKWSQFLYDQSSSFLNDHNFYVINQILK